MNKNKILLTFGLSKVLSLSAHLINANPHHNFNSLSGK